MLQQFENLRLYQCLCGGIVSVSSYAFLHLNGSTNRNASVRILHRAWRVNLLLNSPQQQCGHTKHPLRVIATMEKFL